jgi:hypothetical protein
LLHDETRVVADRKPLGVRRGVLRHLLVRAGVRKNEVVGAPIVHNPEVMLRDGLAGELRSGLPANHKSETGDHGESRADDRQFREYMMHL